MPFKEFVCKKNCFLAENGPILMLFMIFVCKLTHHKANDCSYLYLKLRFISNDDKKTTCYLVLIIWFAWSELFIYIRVVKFLLRVFFTFVKFKVNLHSLLPVAFFQLLISCQDLYLLIASNWKSVLLGFCVVEFYYTIVLCKHLV